MLGEPHYLHLTFQRSSYTVNGPPHSFVEVNPMTNANLFFWHFQNRHIANRQRTVIWLNGGPGCSSEDGAMMEIGPYRMKHGKNGKELEYNDGSWDEFANIMFVDNPVGTGYSYVNGDSYLHELGEMADQMVVFLEKWFQMFPHFAVDDVSTVLCSFLLQHTNSPLALLRRRILRRPAHPIHRESNPRAQQEN